jgi:xanthine dehydrogenase accessory factor
LVSPFERIRVLVRGGGDLGSGVIYRLRRAGFAVVVAETPTPLCVRRAVSYASAVFEEQITVDGLTARFTAPELASVESILALGEIPVLIDPEGRFIPVFVPVVIVDARMAKRNLGTAITDAPLVIALGPGFEAGRDCHAVIETNRGHNLGRVIWQGSAEPDTGLPGQIGGVAALRVLRAPAGGYVLPHKQIGDAIRVGDVVAEVDGQPVVAGIDGVLRGLVHQRVPVTQGLKIGDVDPRARREHCFTISEKALAIGGGVLEAILATDAVRREVASLPGRAILET